MDNQHIINTMRGFLEEVGIAVRFIEIDEETFVPGILIMDGVVWIDEEKLKYPGDVLHEAGHIALASSEERSKLKGDIGETQDDGAEIGAVLWSYAAVIYLGLEPEVVFHPNGYKGDSAWLIENFERKNYIGLPLLQWMGFCKQDDDDPSIPPFPHMQKWLRD